MSSDLRELAARLAETARGRGQRFVFAESCTGGLVSATMARLPGISEFLCGSAVVYRLDSKTQWLGVPPTLFANPGPVSDAVARSMVIGVLNRTPEADWSAAITGHLGPNAPDGLDGLAFIAVACRNAEATDGARIAVEPHWLGDPIPSGMSADNSLRERRQVHAAGLVIEALASAMEASHD